VNRSFASMRIARGFAVVLLAVLTGIGSCPDAGAAEGARGTFTDPEDGQLDLSEWLLDRKGFLPVPIIITEPAVGYGGGVAVLFFRQSMREIVEESKRSGHRTAPDIYGLAVAATENGTEFLAAGGMVSFADGRWRYRGGVAKVNVNLDFYGFGDALGSSGKIGYNLDGVISSQQVLRRIGEGDHFLGLRWIYLDLENRFDASQVAPALPGRSRAMRSSGLGLAWEHDTRDNIFTPARGWIASMDTMFYSPTFGSDNEYQGYRAHVFAYLPVGKSVVLGGRLDSRFVRGDVPFYQVPYIDMRGIPAARYQDENIGVAEIEARWNVTERWALIVFGGAGRAWGERTSFGEAGSAVSKGVGARYLIARRLGLFAGVDVAWGPEDRAFYIQVGNAWR
jgi:hypothetical protein